MMVSLHHIDLFAQLNKNPGAAVNPPSLLFFKVMKTYKSNSEISLSVRVGEGHMHIRFNPTSDGGSAYTTGNPAVQAGLERHPRYGKMFFLMPEQPVYEPVEETEPAPEPGGVKVIKVNALQDAKDYLVETFGISRTQLTSKAKILAQAKANNVEFDGLN